MNFNGFKPVIFFSLSLLLMACSDPEDENTLVELHTVAYQDVIDLSFSETTETTVSINSTVTFTLQGLKSNGIDSFSLTRDLEWSISDGAISRISQQGLLSTGDTAEYITLTAKLGFLSESIDIFVSSAKFDRVVQLDEQEIDIDMCQSQRLNPVGRYIDENGNEEIRMVDNTIIDDIQWSVLNAADSTVSKHAYVETVDDVVMLHTLAAGDFIIQAEALSVITGEQETSQDFEQTIGNQMNSIKICNYSDEDLSSCNVTAIDIEKDSDLSIIAVASYQLDDGSTVNENISQNSQWGLSDSDNASVDFSIDQQYIDVTGEIENTSATLSVACGVIEQSLDAVEDISQGVILESLISCDSNTDCVATSATVTVSELSVLSFDVSANDTDVNDDEQLELDQQPEEISLIVTANYSNNTSQIITDDDDLVYSIIDIENTVIEEKADSPGVFTVLRDGVAKIKLDYRDESFIVIIDVPV